MPDTPTDEASPDSAPDRRDLACGPHCPTPEAVHLEPHVDWIGDWPIAHGEDEDRAVPGSEFRVGTFVGLPDAYCLCGHPNYLSCPRAFSEGVMSMTIEASPPASFFRLQEGPNQP